MTPIRQNNTSVKTINKDVTYPLSDYNFSHGSHGIQNTKVTGQNIKANFGTYYLYNAFGMDFIAIPN